MAGGFWLDLLLAGLLIAALAVFYRLQWPRRAPAEGPGSGERDTALDFRLGRHLRRYYPTLVRQAGFDPEAWRWPYWASKILAGVFFPLLLLDSWPRAPVPVLLLLGLVGFALTDLWLILLRHRRRQRVTLALAYFLDLLVAFLQAGLSLQEAFRRAGRDGFETSHPLAREVLLVSRELDAGREPDVAFQALADRTGVPDLQGVASALRSGLRLGASVVRTLGSQAELLWTKRRELALRKINGAVVKSVFPLMLCGFPIFFVLAFLPGILELVDLLTEVTSVFR
jgi:tight adherence protein C